MYLSNLQQDDVFVESELKSMENLCGITPRKGLEYGIVSNGKLVNMFRPDMDTFPIRFFLAGWKKASENESWILSAVHKQGWS